jgi:hypothetical protein
MRKQHSNHMEDDTFKRILQDKKMIGEAIYIRLSDRK